MNQCTLKKIILTGLFPILFLQVLTCQEKLEIIDKPVNFGMRAASNRNINSIIVHSTFNNSGGEKYDIDLVIKQFSRYGVSSHYVIGRDGSIYLLVNEKDVAFHAGKSILPNGQTNINSTSIGIELMTAFDEAPTEEQIQKLVLLVQDIQKRYNIEFLLRHSDIAPLRKTDPWNMDWEDFLRKIAENENE
jgi:N-acetyl-anhydromuramyl-L-alanine amidase AmpD